MNFQSLSSFSRVQGIDNSLSSFSRVQDIVDNVPTITTPSSTTIQNISALILDSIKPGVLDSLGINTNTETVNDISNKILDSLLPGIFDSLGMNTNAMSNIKQTLQQTDFENQIINKINNLDLTIATTAPATTSPGGGGGGGRGAAGGGGGRGAAGGGGGRGLGGSATTSPGGGGSAPTTTTHPHAAPTNPPQDFTHFSKTYKIGLDTLLRSHLNTLSSAIQSKETAYEKQQQTEKINEYTTEKRTLQLEDSARKFNESNNKVLLIFVITFALVFITVLIYFFLFPGLPLITMLSLIVSIGVILGGRQYYDGLTRWNMDYDEYNIAPPVPATTTDASGNTVDISYNQYKPYDLGGIWGTTTWCLNNSCCANGTKWNPSTFSCIVEN
jgi:hypothetical protein